MFIKRLIKTLAEVYYFSIFVVQTKKIHLKTIFFYFLTVLLITSSCTKVPNDGIPTYITLKKPTIENSSLNQGSTLHQFTDLWIESNGVSFGAYEYPATFAALLKGEQKVIINPGIYFNENIIERVIYPIYEPFVATYNFIQKDTIEISPIFKYRASVDFLYNEDFESSNNFSDMSRTEIGDPNNLENKSGIITLSATDTEKNSSTITPLSISDGKRTYLEFTMKSESFVNIGFKSATGGDNALSLGVYKPVKDWYTSYYEITNFINTVNEGQYIFFIDIQKNNIDEEETTYFDNFKIIQN